MKRGCFCVLWNMGEGGLCISGRENINGRHSMKVDKGREKIVNLDPISEFREN